MWDWKADSRNELRQHLAAIQSEVPPRGEGRQKEHIETWVLRNLLWTLANVSTLLMYPFSVEKGERPDLVLKTPDSSIGVEVTEWVRQDYAQTIAILNQEGLVAPLDLSVFQYGSSARSRNKSRDLIQGEAHPLIGPGWVGDSGEQEWAARMALAVIEKTDLLNKPSFRRQKCNWLAIFDNTPRPGLNLGIALCCLHERLAAIRRGRVEFDRVFVELSTELIMATGKHVYAVRLHRLEDDCA
jgi:hypothetical protein